MKRGLAKKLKRPELEVMEMNAYEAKICDDVICPEDIDAGFEGIFSLCTNEINFMILLCNNL